MNIEILGYAEDLRTHTHVVYAKMLINHYLELVGKDFDQFDIQRRREKHKAYNRLKQDVLAGALLPSITLAIRMEKVDTLLPLVKERNNNFLSEALATPGQVTILDGLQRTFLLNELTEEGQPFQPSQTVLLEFWFEKDIRNLIYRIIVLNAGQKPMSMRHQLELLFLTVKDRLQTEIPGLEIFMEREGNRRTKSRKYPLDRIATSYQCFITKTPEVQRENLVAQKMVEEDALASSEQELGEQFDSYKEYLVIYANLDDDICRIYPGSHNTEIPSGTNWFGSDNVMNSFFAAVADYGTTLARQDRVNKACYRLSERLSSAHPGEDPLGLEKLQQLISGFNTRKVNVGFATRKLITTGFKEYFRAEGDVTLEKCWMEAVD